MAFGNGQRWSTWEERAWVARALSLVVSVSLNACGASDDSQTTRDAGDITSATNGGGSNGASNSGASSGEGPTGSSGSTGNESNTTGANTTGANTAGTNTSGGTGASTSSGTGANTGGGTGTTGDAPDAGPVDMCSSAGTLKPGDSTITFTASGSSIGRKFDVHVPASYTGATPVPLVLDFHGINSSAAEQATRSGYRALSESQGFIHVTPTGVDAAWNVGPCCTKSRTVDDVAFAKDIVTRMRNDGCIDAKRVYATGFSMGGGMSHYLACQAADVFAAVAPSAFDLLEENVGGCKPARPITTILFRGTADNIVRYEGGESMAPNGVATIHFLGAVATFEQWKTFGLCTGTPEQAKYHAFCDTYTQCAQGNEVTLCTIPNGGHSATASGINIAEVGWAMLKRHTLP